jgi:hypothetical protein
VKYMLLIQSGAAGDAFEALSEEDQGAVFGEYMKLAEDPACVHSAQLEPPETATTVRVDDGRTLTTDGPFVETKEALGGYYLFEADNLDAAIDVAARIPAARMGGAVEVRPVVER